MNARLPARDLFFDLAEYGSARARAGETLLLEFSGEESDFIRFNRARVRQAVTVRQFQLTLTLVDGRRQETTSLALTGSPESDRRALAAALEQMRRDLPAAPEDPYILFCERPLQSRRERRGKLPEPGAAVDTILNAAGNSDLVGIFASGPIYRGVASSVGARHWHAVDSFQLDWSLFAGGDKAVKCSWSGQDWDPQALALRIGAAHEQLPYLSLPPRQLEPGSYRAYLAPAALNQLATMLNWDGVSAKAQRTRQSPLQHLVDGADVFSPLIDVCENTVDGLAPGFDRVGFLRPDRVELIRGGRHAGALVGPRSAREYSIEANGAGDDEAMRSLDMAAGSLAARDIPAALDTGIFVSNLWYLNWSDRGAGRVTGMTRFACFWVDRGRIAAPLGVMRFDDSLFRLLGDRLEDLTREREWMLDASSWGERSVDTSRVPGALVRGLQLTL